MTDPRIELVRLPAVDVREVTTLLNEPRNARHMPLAGEPFTPESAAAWVALKDGQWETNGYGPWAVLIDGEFAGWGGFQAERDDADLALVLLPKFWGHGEGIARIMLDRGFGELGLHTVTIVLPYTRSPERVVARWGFQRDGEAVEGGIPFRRFRLTRARWDALARGING